MSDFRLWVARMLGMFSRRHTEQELSEEIRGHLEALAEDHVRRGLSPAQARMAARRDFGSVQQMKETYREQRVLPSLETWTQDVDSPCGASSNRQASRLSWS